MTMDVLDGKENWRGRVFAERQVSCMHITVALHVEGDRSQGRENLKREKKLLLLNQGS